MNDRGPDGGGGGGQLSDADVFRLVEKAITKAGPNEDLDHSEIVARQERNRIADIYYLGGGRIRRP